MNEVNVSIGSRAGATVGIQTPVGATVREATVAYQASASGTEIPTGEWLDAPPVVAEGQYLWTRSYVLYSTGASYTAYSVGYHGEKGADGYTPVKGVDYFDGAKGDKGDKGDQGDKGDKGDAGKDGTSPTAKVTQTDTGATVTVTDASGTTTALLTNGEKGDSGVYVGTDSVPSGTKVWVNPAGEVSGIVTSVNGKSNVVTLGANDVGAVAVYNNAGAHNSIYRGKNLGTAVTAEQYAAIAAGTFEDLYIGDYWYISGVNWRIAAFDYYLTTGDDGGVGVCNTHHVTIVPDRNLYSHVMNDTATTTGGYVGSKMYTEGLETAKTTIKAAFGEAHILTHRLYLCNAVNSSGQPSGRSWYDSQVELMTEQNVYGCKIFGTTGLYQNQEVDKSQYPLFSHNPYLISNRNWLWLRDTVSAAIFAGVDAYGNAYRCDASLSLGVRPAFSIIG